MIENVTIKILDDEYWWGGLAADGIHQPFTKKTKFKRSLRGSLLGNQGNPLLLSSKGRFIYSPDPFTFSFENGYIIISDETDGFLFVDEGYGNLRGAFLAVSKEYFPASGRYPDERLFTQPLYSTQMELPGLPSDKRVLEYAKKCLKSGFPPGIILIDDGWQLNYGNWDFHSGRFKDPKELITTLHAMGFRVMLWISPYISPDSFLGRILGKQNSILIKDKEGRPKVVEWKNGWSFSIDLTNPEGLAWLGEKLKKLQENYCIDGFRFYGGNPEHFSEDSVFFDQCLSNKISELWGIFGSQFSFNQFQCAWKTGGQPLLQDLSDKSCFWQNNSLEYLLAEGIVQGLLGYQYTTANLIGGGIQDDLSKIISRVKGRGLTIEQDYFVRYCQIASLFPSIQFSLAPWRALNKPHLKIILEILRQRQEFFEKYLVLVKFNAKTGEPILRPLEYDFPNRGYGKIIDQIMIGPDIMAAPAVKKGSSRRKAVIPPGTWVEQETGELFNGPAEVFINTPRKKLPVFYKNEP